MSGDPQSRSQELAVESAPPANVSTNPFLAEVGNVSQSIVMQGHDNKTVSYGGITITANKFGPAIVVVNATVEVQRRSEAPLLRQRKPELIGRDREIALCRGDDPGMTELVADFGLGKSSLLAYLSHTLPATAPAHRHGDGLAYVSLEGSSFDESLWRIWSLFFSTNTPYRYIFSPDELSVQITDVDALLLLDDCALSESELRTLDTAVGRSTVILATEDSRISAFGHTVFLSALSDNVIREILSQRAAQIGIDADALTKEEIERIVHQSGGNPAKAVRSLCQWASKKKHLNVPSQASDVIRTVQVFSSPVPGEILDAIVGGEASTTASTLAAECELRAHSPKYSYPWPKNLASGADVERTSASALSYIVENLDRAARDDDFWAISVELMKWAAGIDPLRLHGSSGLAIAKDALRLGKALSEVFMLEGLLDRWETVATHALVLSRKLTDPSEIAWAYHNLGTIALCRNNWHEAYDLLDSAIEHYETSAKSTSQAKGRMACEQLLLIASQRSGQDPDDEAGAIGQGDLVPWSPNLGAGGSDDHVDHTQELEEEKLRADSEQKREPALAH